MTDIKIYDTGATYMVEAEGHAEGRPDVCAALSTLTQTLVTWLENTAQPHGSAEREGYLCVSAPVGPFRPVFDFFELGLLCLAETAPDAVKVSIKRRDRR